MNTKSARKNYNIGGPILLPYKFSMTLKLANQDCEILKKLHQAVSKLLSHLYNVGDVDQITYKSSNKNTFQPRL